MDVPAPRCDTAGDLVAEAAAGSGVALARLLRLIRPSVTRYCRARLAPAQADRVATRICADVLAALPRHLDTGRPIEGFVYRTAAAAVAEHGDAPGGDPLHGLPPDQREIMVLRLVVGLTAEQTAAALGTSTAAVRVTQHRALAALRTTLQAA